MRSKLILLSLILGLSGLNAVHGARDYLSDWPEGASPEVVGKLLSENWLAREFDYEDGSREFVIYPEICTWYGSLTVTKLAGLAELNQKLIAKFDYFLTEEGSRHISNRAHVDYRVAGAVPLEIFIQTGEQRYLELGKRLADAQWANPTEDGVTGEARYWIDDMYMVSAVQSQAYRATNDPVYLDRNATTMVAYLGRLQEPNGLFYHAPDSPFFWGRGNGWQAAGITELLRSLPEDHPHYARIMDGYKLMMAALLRYQGADGMWRQLVDRPESWPETSGTGMFTYAMVSGIKNGWLDSYTYGPAARKAWLALVGYLETDGDMQQVCIGTNKANQVVGPDLGDQLAFYLARPRRTGDLHGQAPMLWTASALLR